MARLTRAILLRPFATRKPWLVSTLLAVALLSAVSRGHARHLEFSHQQVQADALTQSLDDIDKLVREIFQVAPTWTVENEDDEAMLIPKSSVGFSRRPVGPN